MYNNFGQFIDGKWQQAEKKETYDVINPATEEVIGKASKASSVAGLITSYVSFFSACCHLPSMNCPKLLYIEFIFKFTNLGFLIYNLIIYKHNTQLKINLVHEKNYPYLCPCNS